jgi:hypothetical protein
LKQKQVRRRRGGKLRKRKRWKRRKKVKKAQRRLWRAEKQKMKYSPFEAENDKFNTILTKQQNHSPFNICPTF